MALVSADQIIGKDLYAKTNVNIRRSPTTDAEIISKVKSGSRVGTVYSWVYGRDKNGNLDGSVWWTFVQKFDGKIGYAKHDSRWYDAKTLREQGVKTETEIEKEKEDKKKREDMTWYERIFADLHIGEGIKKVLIYGGIAYVVVKLGQTYIVTKNQKQVSQ